MIKNLVELWRYRALLWALTVRELKARYRASVLGFLWTFLNPTLNMIVYVMVFGFIMQNTVPRYPFVLFCGLLPWINFSSSVVAGTSAVSDRKDLLTKVRFPAQVLPATVVLTNTINFLLSLPLLIALGAAYAWFPSWHYVFVIPVLIVQTFFTLAVTYLLSALNVAFRDLQHVVSNVVQMLFFLSPVLWPIELLDGKHFDLLGAHVEDVKSVVIYANPLATLMVAWRDIFNLHQAPAAGPLLAVAGISLVVMWLSAGVFERRREEFAELV